MHHRAKDISGLRVGYLTALVYAGSNGRRSLWSVRCDCGAEITMAASDLQEQRRRGIQASCGCKRLESIGAANRTHGMSTTPQFAVWRSMLDRCRLPTHQAWRNYGGRGISVCERWQESFEKFWEDMGPTYRSGLSIERMNNAGNYEPTNCRWATWAEQSLNKRTNVRIQTPNGEMTVTEAAARYGLKLNTLLYRIKQGWGVRAACMTSSMQGRGGASLSATGTASP